MRVTSDGMEIVRKQKVDESVLIIRGKDRGRAAWHYILVPFHKLAHLREQPEGSNIDITQFGEVLTYKDENGVVHPCSGWGEDPPEKVQHWIVEFEESF
ncbi:unnamed protein product [Didymodactylos carnosus]|uniref:Uncharacterized protein n=1 Tax=Didymodactylos carnosus TaxID=1234261 RepID=A0A814WUE9_9BILA|nr:unnamed protein product [Didymodactylos carnosus]CAF1207153.1 unnamed protein product [Didymodactylos carnosus]CAF3756626.1 unnamed protein product [Didymodactylos carnosus]CAF3971332.1 unnamed protein product [Didymodactylos carnosus]